HLGADETSEQLSTINWLICGKEYIMLVDRKGLVRDVLEFPPHSRKSPAYSGICKLNGQDLPDIFEAVLNAQVAGDELPALSAWKIDLDAAKFIKAPLRACAARETASTPSMAAGEALSPSSAAIQFTTAVLNATSGRLVPVR